MNAYNPIIDPETSVWINASAGTGKTKALTDRILSLLLQGRHNILCMTFTKAAANEMKERVLTCLHKWTYLDRTQIKSEISSLIPTAVQEQHIDIASTMFKKYANSNVSIETIHSFCYNLLLEFSQEIDPNSRIITDTTYLFRKSAISALTDPSMTDEINIIEKYLTSKEQIFYLLEELHKKNHHSYDLSETENELKKLQLSPIQNLELENVIELLRASTKKDIELSYNFETLMDPSNWTEKNLTKIFLTAQNKPRITSISKKLTTTNPSIQSSIDYIFEVGLQYLSSLNTPKIAAKTSALLKIYNLSMEYYKRKKQESNGLDYNDIIDKAIYLITEYEFKESVLFSLNNRFEHILIDETQDNTPSHWKIIQHICEEFFSGEGTTNTKRTVFFVGDAKQSIYGFLNSSPELFKNMRTFFMSRDHNLQIMQLNKSFRSAKPVLDFVNIIINKIGDYLPDTATHIPARQDPCCGYVEIWPKFSHPNAAQIDNLNLQQLSSKTIAKKIKTWLDNGRILNAKNRAVQPSDIMILFQKRCSLMTYLVDELLANNLPVESIQNPEKDTFIVSNLIAIGNFILQPHNDEALVDVLRSGLVSIKLSEEEIIELMWEKKHGSLWDLLNRDTSPLTKQLKALIMLSQTHTPYLLYRSILFNSEYINYPDYYKPIYLFLEELANFEKQNILSLASFLIHIKYSKFRYTHDPQSNCISIRTVHGAKGLQAPIVFIADATSSRSATDSLLFSGGTPFWDNKYHERCRQIRQSNKSKSLNEYMRLFYVAITRAEDELYILGMDVKGEGDNTWYNSIPTDLDTKLIDLNPMFPTEVEARCVNKNYELQYMNQK